MSDLVLKPLDVEGYFAGDDGNIYSTRTNAGKTNGMLHKLKAGRWSRYLRVGLWDAPKVWWRPVHQLVAEAFHGPKPTPLHQALHKDDDAYNNLPSNLYWGTPKQNGEDRVKNGSSMRGAKHWSVKLSEDQARTLKFEALAKTDTVSELARRYDVSRKLVRMIRSGRAWGYLEPRQQIVST